MFKVYKGFLKKKQSLAEFDEPIMILMKNSGKVEFYENATGGKFIFQHSSGEERFIILDQRFMNNFDYGGNSFRGYVCHEDFPTPLPENPIVTTELVAIMYEKVLNDIKKWKVEEEKAKALKIKSWAILLAVAGGIFLLWIILKPTPQQVADAVNTTINATLNATSSTKVTVIS